MLVLTLAPAKKMLFPNLGFMPMNLPDEFIRDLIQYGMQFRGLFVGDN
jgi:hypothetical protein